MFENSEKLKESDAYQKQMKQKYDAIEAEIQKGYVNTHKFLFECYPDFEPSLSQRIEINETDIKKDYQEKLNSRNSLLSELSSSIDKPTKNLTYYLKSLVNKNFE